MKINQLPARTFNKVGMNEANIDYEPGDYRVIEISEDTILNLDTPEDVKVNINVKKNKEVSVIMNYESKDTLNVKTDINVEAGGQLKLIQIDASPKGNRLINENTANLDEDAYMHIAQILPGRGNVYTGCVSELKGNRCRCNMDVAYLTGKDQKTDMNFVSNHRGKETVCEIQADGVLRDNGVKLFRGTIDFKTGAAGSSGQENEKVLLLGDDVVNQTIPLILCTEEDVEGAHGAQIGSLADDVMFYFASRGINREQAEKMIAYGSFNRLIRQIDDEKIRDNTEKLLLEVL